MLLKDLKGNTRHRKACSKSLEWFELRSRRGRSNKVHVVNNGDRTWLKKEKLARRQNPIKLKTINSVNLGIRRGRGGRVTGNARSSHKLCFKAVWQ